LGGRLQSLDATSCHFRQIDGLAWNTLAWNEGIRCIETRKFQERFRDLPHPLSRFQPSFDGLAILASRPLARQGGLSFGGLACRTANEGPQPGEQLRQIEGLHQVVVGTEVKPTNPVAQRVFYRQHQNGRRFDQTQALEHLPAVHLRHEDIQNNAVVIRGLRLKESLLAIGSGVHGVARLAERLSEAALQAWLVLRYQDFHRFAS
jgi:hypothetical protein